MSDVRLTATNPEDSSVVPVACNAKGELKLEEPTVSSDEYVAKAGDTMTGSLHLGDNITLNPDGSAQFASGAIDFYVGGSAQFGGNVEIGNSPLNGNSNGVHINSVGLLTLSRGFSEGVLRTYTQGIDLTTLEIDGSGQIKIGGNVSGNAPNISLNPDGSGSFSNDVIVGSRSKQWMIVESSGLAHLVEQTRSVESPVKYPPLRDIPGELTMVEEQLQKVLEKLRMVPEAGWEVWDGSDEN